MKILPFGTPISSASGLQPAASYIGVFLLCSCQSSVLPRNDSSGLFGYRASDLLVASVLLSDSRTHFALLLLAESGGLKWTRTIDLTLIRRVL